MLLVLKVPGVPGTNQFIPGKSIITLEEEEIETLIGKFRGTGQRINEKRWGTAGYKERIDFGKIIGMWAEENSPTRVPTTMGGIFYDGKWQMHLVPLRPKKKG